MPDRDAPRPGRAILGGSFNPPHAGHLRLAIEACEALGEYAHGLDMVPCATPPHKSLTGMLPFDLRAALLEACLHALPRIRCNRLEGERPGPSYTWDTLQDYRQANPEESLFFLLGSPDFALLPAWRHGPELPSLCHLLVAPRDGQTRQDFLRTARALWPEAKECAPPPFSACSLLPPFGHPVHFLPVPWLEVSASRIRQRWMQGRNVDFLVPREALALLREQEATVRACWQGDGETC